MPDASLPPKKSICDRALFLCARPIHAASYHDVARGIFGRTTLQAWLCFHASFKCFFYRNVKRLLPEGADCQELIAPFLMVRTCLVKCTLSGSLTPCEAPNLFSATMKYFQVSGLARIFSWRFRSEAGLHTLYQDASCAGVSATAPRL